MKKTAYIVFLIFLLQNNCFSQDAWINGAKRQLAEAKNDTARIEALVNLSSAFKFNQPDSAMHYAAEAIKLARKTGFPQGEVEAMRHMSSTQSALGNEAQALKIILRSLKIARENNLFFEEAFQLAMLGLLKRQTGDYEEALRITRESIRLLDSIQNISYLAISQLFMGQIFLSMNQMDSASYYYRLAHENQQTDKWVSVYANFYLGELHEKTRNFDDALNFYRQSLALANGAADVFNANLAIGKVYNTINVRDSSIYYAQKAMEIATQSGFLQKIVDANILLSKLFEESEPEKALQFNKNAILYKDSLENIRKSTAMESFYDFDEQQRQFELEKARTEYKNHLRRNAFLGSTFTLMVIAVFIFLLYRRKQKEKQRVELAYSKLKSAQAQLIQSEKMASLGELTAGIAHEIQNPLNFVNNFSEVNNELIDDLKVAIANNDQQEIEAILNDLKENEGKVSNHGKRAESIVKGMLLHTRGSSGKKELTDINALCDEYLRLAYHGFRAKDKSFNADFKLEADESLPKINVVPQDIGRVLLNLINNAFYVVNKKANDSDADYKPLVTVSTKRLDKQVNIRVIDNGPGIPDKIKDKIFQPFFTTKSTVEGTGLGLSLSYDVVKAHGGKITVESLEGQRTEFTVEIPLKS